MVWPVHPRPHRRPPIAGLATRLRVKLPRVSKLRVVVEGGRARILRPGARYAVTRDGEAYQGIWVRDGDELPAGASDSFTEDEARIALALLRDNTRTGRPARAPTTEDGRLIDEVCRVRKITQKDLAAELGTGAAVVSRARRGEQPLSQAHRDRLATMIGKG